MSGLREEHEIGLDERGRLRRRSQFLGLRPHPRNNLPEEIMLNILSRLPVESVLECRLVCKTWSNLPLLDDNTYFADMHLRRHHRGLLLPHHDQQQHLDHHHDHDDEYQYHHHNHSNSAATASSNKMSFLFQHYKFYYVEYDENDEQSFQKLGRRIKLPSPRNFGTPVGSCNGLICLSKRYSKSTFFVDDPVYICNPITREYVTLPRCCVMSHGNYRNVRLVHGFGYHPFTNEYKVVRIYYCRNQRPVVGHVQVYTLGSGSGWRNKGETTHILQLTFRSNGALFNGALHWLSHESNIVAFDLAAEEFHLLPTPPFSYPKWSNDSTLWMLGGSLCLLHETSYFSSDIWLLKKNDQKESSSTSSYYDMKGGKEYQTWSWSREFSVELKSMNLNYQPFALTKSGEIIFLHGGKIIVLYDPKTATSKEVGNVNNTWSAAVLMSHFSTFVSLKALGENAKIIGSADEDSDTKSSKMNRSFKKKRSIKRKRSIHLGQP
ncbi:F-box domain [Macleaya cordata]|uniref:F-box domain n=1 Tax=Macleaya cordata TaxID=56857 RepID=A0A200PZ95_MACCD|nr:F-box domain [Macleaya cordata]